MIVQPPFLLNDVIMSNDCMCSAYISNMQNRNHFLFFFVHRVLFTLPRPGPGVIAFALWGGTSRLNIFRLGEWAAVYRAHVTHQHGQCIAQFPLPVAGTEENKNVNRLVRALHQKNAGA